MSIHSNGTRLLHIAVISIALLPLVGCATITRGTTQAWTVESEPLGAQVTLSSGETCTTLCTLKKRRKHPFQVIVEKSGYEVVHTQVESSVGRGGAVGMAGNVLIGGLIGIGVDVASGAARELTPNPLQLKLVRIEGSVSALPEALPEAPPKPANNDQDAD